MVPIRVDSIASASLPSVPPYCTSHLTAPPVASSISSPYLMMVLVGTLFSPPGLYRVRVVLVKPASLPPAEAAVELAVLVVVLAEEPPQAARPKAAAPIPATFRKLRREIFFITVSSCFLGQKHFSCNCFCRIV